MAPVQFGSYQIVRKIGAGGMAQVFEAQRVGLEGFSRRVALKCILPSMTRDPRFVKMFVNEARLGSQLHHPNIVEIQDFNQVNDIYYIAMEYVEGVDLAEVIHRFRSANREFPPGLAVAIMLQTLDGLGYAHEATTDDGQPMAIIHRDLKPSNLLLTKRGTIKIADFGIAKAATNAYQTRTSEITKGSLAYMAPEQITREAPLSPASDLFSLGAVLFEMLCLRALFDGENMPSIMFKVAQVEIERDISDLEQVYPQFVPILQKALARDVEERYHHAAEMAEDLRPLKDEFPQAPTIAEIASEYGRDHDVEEEADIGESTAAMLGFHGMHALEGSARNLALFEASSDPGMGESAGTEASLDRTMALRDAPFTEMPYEADYLPNEEHAVESSAAAEEQGEAAEKLDTSKAPRRSMAAPLIGFTALLIAALAIGAFIMRGGQGTRLQIASVPAGARVLLDGELLTVVKHGKPIPVVTPATIELPEGGRANLALELEGYEPFSARLDYEPGAHLNMSEVLTPIVRTGTLEITSVPPGASVYLDGKAITAKTPTRISDLPGNTKVHIRLKLEGYTDAEGSIEIKPKATVFFTSTLIKTPVPETKPEPAPEKPKTLVSSKGSQHKEAASREPKIASTRTEPPSNPPPPKPAAMPGTLIVSSVPPDSVIYIDGLRKGTAPVTLQLPSGKHKVRIERFDGSLATEFSVSVPPQGEITRVWDLDGRQFISE